MKTSGEFHGFDQAGEGASRDQATPGTVLWHMTLRVTHSVGAEAQRGGLNPGKAPVLPSLCVIPSAPLVGDAGREASLPRVREGRAVWIG